MANNKFDTKKHQEKVDQDKVILRQEMNNHRGKSKKIPVLELCETLNFDRRYLRELVHEINLDDTETYAKKLILTDTKEGCYWLDDPIDDAEFSAVYYNSEHNRALKILSKTTASREKAEAIHGKVAFARALEIVKGADANPQQEGFGW